MTAASHVGNVEGIAPIGAACDNCGEAHVGAMVCSLDPADYAGLNLGPDVACTLTLCPDCGADFLPWAFPDAQP